MTYLRAEPSSATLLAVLGVVYGDIGTSPLYAFKTSLHLFGGAVTEAEILGILSMIFWSLILIVTVKYVMLVMQADNHGEGGILALMVLARQSIGPKMFAVLGLVGVAGACLFFGDGAITPAISVLSAVEGLEVSAPNLKAIVLPISAVIIILLFAIQKGGTSRMGSLFGPVMIVWFAVLAALGLWEIAHNPHVLLAMSPSYGMALCLQHKDLALAVLGAVVLCVTGAEALYADMGHFGTRPIRLTWTFFVLPALVLNYFGQGAFITGHPDAIDNPFFLMAPEWFRWPLVILATVATVIASQALISGAFSVARQCMQLGFLPRMAVQHTSTVEGQIYVPQVNTMLAISVLLLVFTFKTSDNLAAAYGIAVTGTFLCTAVLAAVVFQRQFHWPYVAALSVFGLLFLIDTTFFAANTMKFLDGGWVPIAMALVLIILMTSWKRGRDLLLVRWRQDSMHLSAFIALLPKAHPIRVPGLAVFLTADPDRVPTALMHNLKHNKVLHEHVLFVTVQTVDEPTITPERRAEVTKLSPGIHRIVLRYGFMESPDLPRALTAVRDIPFDPMQASYFLGRNILVPAMIPRLPWWRLRLFLVMSRNAASATEFFRIPSDRAVELGVQVAI